MKEAKAVGTRVDATKKFQPTCIECTPKQVHKLTCKICNKTMELDKFSKAQRRMAAKDNGARCLKCVTLREDLDWVHDAVPGTIRYEPDDDEEEAMEAGGLPPF
ncbi:hypothetical protein HK104_001383 [Borealophlyctis nickersoniae]|nr:hypothetical protein HK104_001383 [Borealophlyctis nickersoniae]